MSAAVPFTLAAPDTLVGLPRTDVRLISDGKEPAALVTYGQGLGGIAVIERARRSRPGSGDSPLGGACRRSRSAARPGTSSPTALGTVVTVERGGVSYTLARLGAAERGRRPRCRGGAGVTRRRSRPAGLVKTYGEITAVDHVDLTVERGRRLRLPRAERRGQDDVAAHAARPDPAERRAARGCSAAIR